MGAVPARGLQFLRFLPGVCLIGMTSSSMNYHLFGRIEAKGKITTENSSLGPPRLRSGLQKQGVTSYWTEHRCQTDWSEVAGVWAPKPFPARIAMKGPGVDPERVGEAAVPGLPF